VTDRGVAKLLGDRASAVADDRRRLDEEERLPQKLEVQTGRVRRIFHAIGLQLRNGRHQSIAQVGRPKPDRDANNAGQQDGAHQAFPAELSPTQEKQQRRRDQKSGAAGHNKEDVGEKEHRDGKQSQSRAPSFRAAGLAGVAQKRKRADQKVRALKDIILGRNAECPATPRQPGD